MSLWVLSRFGLTQVPQTVHWTPKVHHTHIHYPLSASMIGLLEGGMEIKGTKHIHVDSVRMPPPPSLFT